MSAGVIALATGVALIIIAIAWWIASASRRDGYLLALEHVDGMACAARTQRAPVRVEDITQHLRREAQP